MSENKLCELCKKYTDSVIVNLSTNKEYPFCDECAKQGLYNKKIFEFKSGKNE